MTKIHNNPELKHLRLKLRREATKSEQLLWAQLKSKLLGVKFRRQHSIGNYIVDFYCPSRKLIIEVDGITHEDPAVRKRDAIREKYLQSLGLLVVRIPSYDVFHDLEDVVNRIYVLLHGGL